MGTYTKLYTPRGPDGAALDLPSTVLNRARPSAPSVKPAQPLASLMLANAEEIYPAAPRRQTRDVEGALGMLQRAASAFEYISQRLAETERDRNSAVEYIEEQAQVALRLHQVIEGLKNKVAEVERESAEFSRRLEVESSRAAAAEERATYLETSTREAERQLADTEASLARLHDSVVSTFGQGSFTDHALSALTNGLASKAA